MPTTKRVVEHEPWCAHELHEVVSAADTATGEQVEICVAAPTHIGDEETGFGYVDLRWPSDTNKAIVMVDLGGLRGGPAEVTAEYAPQFADRLEEHAKEIAEAIRHAGRTYAGKVSA